MLIYQRVGFRRGVRVDWAHNESKQNGKACSLLNLLVLVLCAQSNAENGTQQSHWVPNLAVGKTHIGANRRQPAGKRSESLKSLVAFNSDPFQPYSQPVHSI